MRGTGESFACKVAERLSRSTVAMRGFRWFYHYNCITKLMALLLDDTSTVEIS
jgi:hypothetical protein